MHGRWGMEIEKRKISIRHVALFLLFFLPALAYLAIPFNGGNTLLFEDGLLAQFPFRVFLHNAFANGFSPQWVPNSACGISLLAEGQSGICFPGTQIIYRMFPAEVGWIIEIILAQFVAFTLCYFLFRHLRVSSVSSFFGASIYTFCAFAFPLTGVPAMMWCYSLLPGIFLLCDHFIEGRPFSFAYLMIIFALVFLTGHPVMVVYIGVVVSAFFVVHMMSTWATRKTIRKIPPRFLALLGVTMIAALIASPQILPILQEYPFSARTADAGASLETLQNTVYLKPIWVPLSLFPTPGKWEFMSSTIRYPFYSLFLVPIGMLFGEKGNRRSYFIFLSVFSILMALGPYVGLWKLVHSLPGLRHLRFPFRWLFFLPICVSFFSARGADHLLSRSGGLRPVSFTRALKSILALGLAVGVVFFIRHRVLLQQTERALESSPLLTGVLWLCSVGMVLAAFLSLTKNATRRGVILGVTLSVICLFATLAFNVQDPTVVHDLATIGWHADSRPSVPQTYRTLSALSPYEVWLTNSIHRHYQYTPNLTVLNGTLSTGYYFSFFPYWSANVSRWSQDALNGDHNREIYLNLTSSRWLFIPDDSSFQRLTFPTESFRGIKAYKNPDALPRASVVFSCRLLSDDRDLLTFLESSDFDPRRELAIFKQDANAWNLRSDAHNPVDTTVLPKATIVVDRPDRVEVALTPAPSREAFMVLSDTYYPGWKALVDGVDVKVLRTNYAFRGIKLPAGAKHVVFFYDPLVPDTALSLPTFLLVVLWGAVYLRHRLIEKRNAGYINVYRQPKST
jgi:hypothetical protein